MMVSFVISGISYFFKKTCSKEADWSLNGQDMIAVLAEQTQRHNFHSVSQHLAWYIQRETLTFVE